MSPMPGEDNLSLAKMSPMPGEDNLSLAIMSPVPGEDNLSLNLTIKHLQNICRFLRYLHIYFFFNI